MNDENANKSTSLTFYVLMWVALFAVAVIFFDKAISERHNPNSSPVSRIDGEQSEVVLQRNSHPHFVATGFVNNREVVFMLDTGATDVVISEAVARRAGMKKGQGAFANTANGVITVFNSRIDTLRLGGITLHNVEASINPHMDDQFALLGMSFLGELEMLQKDNTLTLRY